MRVEESVVLVEGGTEDPVLISTNLLLCVVADLC